MYTVTCNTEIQSMIFFFFLCGACDFSDICVRSKQIDKKSNEKKSNRSKYAFDKKRTKKKNEENIWAFHEYDIRHGIISFFERFAASTICENFRWCRKRKKNMTNTNSNMNAVHLTRVYCSDMPLIDAKSFHTLIVEVNVNGNLAPHQAHADGEKGVWIFFVSILWPLMNNQTAPIELMKWMCCCARNERRLTLSNGITCLFLFVCSATGFTARFHSTMRWYADKWANESWE